MGLITFIKQKRYDYINSIAETTITNWINDISYDVIEIIDNLITEFHENYPDENEYYPRIAYGLDTHYTGYVKPFLSFSYVHTKKEPISVLDEYKYRYNVTTPYPALPASYGPVALSADEYESFLYQYHIDWPGFDDDGEMIDYAVCALADVVARYYDQAGWTIIPYRDTDGFEMRYPKS